ncbi:preprotein translocase subunit YajC [soil metagenome]
MNAEQVAGLLPLLLIVAVFWFLVMRPARRRQQDAARLQRNLAVGDRIMLTSGIFGSVRAIGDESLEVDAAPGVVLSVHRQAVAKIVEPHGSDQGDDPRA